MVLQRIHHMTTIDSQRRTVDERREDLPPEIPISFARTAWLSSEPRNEQRQGERANVRQQVARISEQRERIR